MFDSDYGDDWGDGGVDDGNLPPMYGGGAADPTVPSGYKVCYNPTVQGMPVTIDAPTNQSNWRVDHYVGANDELYYYYHTVDGSDFFWACPTKGGVPVSNKAEVKEIQRALQKRGHNPGSIDGVWGPNTCGAFYGFAFSQRGYSDPTLDESLFGALELGGRGFGAKYARACDDWFTGDLAGGPLNNPPIITPPTGGTEPNIVVDPPQPIKAGIPWWLALIMVGGVAGTIWHQSRKKKGKKKRR